MCNGGCKAGGGAGDAGTGATGKVRQLVKIKASTLNPMNMLFNLMNFPDTLSVTTLSPQLLVDFILVKTFSETFELHESR